MFLRQRIFIRNLLRKLRGENFESITAQGNKQILKLKKVAEYHKQEAEAAQLEASHARIYAIAKDNEAIEFNNQEAKAKVMQSRLENFFTVSDEDLEKIKS